MWSGRKVSATLLRVGLTNHVNCITVRCAGGGGRIPKRPPFNWKQQRILGLDKEKTLKPFRNSPSGFYDDLIKHFDPSRGDRIISLADLKPGEEIKIAPVEVPPENHRKVASPSLLFGSQKTVGALPYKDKFGALALKQRRILARKQRRQIRENLLQNETGDAVNTATA